jgi:hypothetical protein
MLYTKLLHGKKIDTCFPSKIQKPKKKKKKGERAAILPLGFVGLRLVFAHYHLGLDYMLCLDSIFLDQEFASGV